MRALCLVALLTSGVTAQDEPGFFRDVLPILQVKCAGCHQPSKHKDGLVLTSHDAVMRGKVSDDGDEVIVVPGTPDDSLLFEVVIPSGDEPPTMPDKGEPLTATEIEVLRAWIAAGALDDTPSGAKSLVHDGQPPRYHTLPVITSLAWSNDGALLAVPGRNEVLLHRVDDPSAEPVRLIGLAERIESMAFSPDGTRLAVVGGSPARFGELQIWTLDDHALALSKVITHDCLFGVSWSPDSRLVAFGATDKAVRALDAATGVQVLFQGAHDDWVLDTAFSLDGSHLVTVGRDRSMKLTKVDSQQFIDNITSITPGALKGGLITVARHPSRDELLVGGADGTPRTYKMFREKKRVIGDDFNLLHAFDALSGRVFAAEFVGDGARIVTAASHATGGEARMYRTDDGALIWRHETPAGSYAVAPSPDGGRIALAGFEGVVEILAAESGETLRRFVPVPITDDPGSSDPTGRAAETSR